MLEISLTFDGNFRKKLSSVKEALSILAAAATDNDGIDNDNDDDIHVR